MIAYPVIEAGELMQPFDTLRTFKLLLDIKRVLDMSSGFHKLWHISTGVELGIFDNLAKSPMSSQEYASAYNLDSELLDIWFRLGVSYGLLKRYGNKYSNSKFAAMYMCRDSKYCFANFPWGVTSMHSRIFERLPVLMQNKERYRISPDMALKVAEGTRFLDNWALEVLLILPVYKSGCRILDIGCGQGYYLIELAKKNQSLTGVGIERENTVYEDVRKRIEAKDLSNRLSVLHGDAKELDIGKDYDICLINNMLYYLSKDDAVILLKKVKKSLKPDGLMAIQQPVMCIVPNVLAL